MGNLIQVIKSNVSEKYHKVSNNVNKPENKDELKEDKNKPTKPETMELHWKLDVPRRGLGKTKKLILKVHRTPCILIST